MFCPSCGFENDASAGFCKSCGRSLSNTVTAEPATSSGSGPTAQPHIPNYLVQAILVTIFCCQPFGIVSLVFAAQVNGKIVSGDIEGARRMSEDARKWAWVAFWTGLGILIASVLIYAVLIAFLFVVGEGTEVVEWM